MKRKLITKLLIVALSFALVLQPVTPALADLNTEMSNMFNQWGMSNNTTNPGAYNGQTRGFVSGGRVTAVAPTKTITPGSFKAPSISAGCGGVDIFAGSFSVINASQFTAFLEAIGQNALGYGFSMALEAVCPMCNSAIKEMKAITDKMNAFTANSCQAAKLLVNSAADRALGNELESCTGPNKDDPERYWTDCISNKSPQQVLDHNILADPHSYKSSGQQAAEKNTDLSTIQKQYAVSIVGTWWYNSAFSPNPFICQFQPPTITLESIMIGGDLKLVKCGTGDLEDPNQTCSAITTEDITGVIGQQALAKTQMTGILTSIKNQLPMTTTEIAFVNSSTIVPIMSLLTSLSQSNSEGMQNAVIDYLSDLVALMVATEYMKTYIGIMNLEMVNVNTCAGQKEYMDAAMQDTRTALREGVEKYTKTFDAQAKVINFIADLDQKIGKMASKSINAALAYR